MVIGYPSSAEGSFFSFLLVTPRVIFWRRGSVIPSILLQVSICTGLSFVAIFWNPLRLLPDDAKPLDAYTVMGFLISFLLVFKTQSAFNQNWLAITHVEQLMVIYREMGMGACTTFDWDKGPEVKEHARKLMRLLVLHFHVVVEYFRRTGANAIKHAAMKDKLRSNVMRLAGENEVQILYPDEPEVQSGSSSKHSHSHPMILVVWMDLVIARCFKNGGCLSAPHAAGLSNHTGQLMERFQAMNQIDKTQFPFPYAQLVKLLLVAWSFSLPFVLERSCGHFAPFAVTLIALAVYGLDEVAEILESPFGTDPNDIDLEALEVSLVNDLELMYYGCSMRMDVVFTDESDLCLRGTADPTATLSGPARTTMAQQFSSKNPWNRSTESADHHQGFRLQKQGAVDLSKNRTSQSCPRNEMVRALMENSVVLDAAAYGESGDHAYADEASVPVWEVHPEVLEATSPGTHPEPSVPHPCSLPMLLEPIQDE